MYKILLAIILSFFSISTIADNFEIYQKICSEIGFKKKTEAFGNCVIDLVSRENDTKNIIADKKIGDGSLDDTTCQKYGFLPSTPDYAECRLQIDIAKQQASQQQAQFESQQRQYQAELKAYEDRKSKEAGLKLMQFGLGVLAGNKGRDQSSDYGAPPITPTFTPSTQTYILPGGRHMNCTTTGSITNCF